ncbi:MAG TPA: hypothetical protein VNA25_03400 [Phycisphaerae bacterium]|nr:hypothetical protein [Phycisphaerae bacterium]
MSRRGSTAELKGRFAPQKLDTRDKQHSIAGYVIRVLHRNLVAVGNDRKPVEQIGAFVDALHWRRQVGNDNQELTFCIYSGGKNDRLVEDAISTLFSSLNENERENLRVMKDDQPANLAAPDFAALNTKWETDLSSREIESLPALADELQRIAEAPSFRWYRNVTEKVFSGRIEGLEVCTLSPETNEIVFQVGRIGIKGDESKARRRFRELARAPKVIYKAGQLQEAARFVKLLAEDRKSGSLRNVEREHHLESRILRQAIRVGIEGIGSVDPVIPQDRLPFQFPTLWSFADSPRLIDVLGRVGKTPWVLELKEFGSKGRGQYYRYGIAQAVLYRHFIRTAKDLHFWFEDYGLEPKDCQAAVAFPRLHGDAAQRLRDEHTSVARMFGIQIVELSVER